MSIAGRRSNQGDEYQLCIALHWLIRMLTGDDIDAIQVDSVGWPGKDMPVQVDDVVIRYTDGRSLFTQAKKNQPKHRSWSVGNSVLQKELLKARDQLEASPTALVRFYSRTPFGDFQQLLDACRTYPDYASFNRDASGNLRETLSTMTRLLDRSEEVVFGIVSRISIGPLLGFDEWDRQNLADLDRIVSGALVAKEVLERLIDSHQSNLRGAPRILSRSNVLQVLEKRGIYKSPNFEEEDIVAGFTRASRIGREWIRSIDGAKIQRPEVEQILDAISEGARSILVKSQPGGGKTCLLLDVAEEIGKNQSLELLFVKGDRFEEAEDESDLERMGLPPDIVGQCARLAERRRVAVVIDSLDVLSLSRNHTVLKLFLRTMDQLATIENLSLVAACREFDLQFDPNLRARQWSQTIDLHPFDFNTTVLPLLQEWDTDPDTLSPQLQQLICIPQNLRLFSSVCKHPGVANIRTEHELHNVFLEEIVGTDPALGPDVLNLLAELSATMLRDRVTKVSAASFATSEIRRRLISLSVLISLPADFLAFSHQTLGDCLAVRNALSNGQTLHDFILAHPPLPFLRPAVRTYFFHLRIADTKSLRRQFWRVIEDQTVAYHLKRLLVESFAEVEPQAGDHRLASRLFLEHPELFERFLWRIKANKWFQFLKDIWLPMLLGMVTSEKWFRQFIQKLKEWQNRFPEEVIALRRRAMEEAWSEPQERHTMSIGFALNEFTEWGTPGVRDLLELLLRVPDVDSVRPFSKAISKWVEATGEGDDLLWRCISMGVDWETPSWIELSKAIHCSPHDFHKKDFLEERLCVSDELLNLAIDAILYWSEKSHARYGKRLIAENFLHSTSWEYRHVDRDNHSKDGLRYLVAALELAITKRSMLTDEWWQTNEPTLRNIADAGIRYILIEAYKSNPEPNREGIEAQLLEAELFRFAGLEHELGELMQSAYYLISPETQEQNQALLLNLYADREDEAPREPEWDARQIYNRLIWVPAMYRTPETVAYLTCWERRFGYILPSPRIMGWVQPPLKITELLNLSDISIHRILRHYEKYTDSENLPGRIIGGRSSVESILQELASFDPMRCIAWLPDFLSKGLYPGYTLAVLEGSANHLRYRFGNLQPPNKEWKPIEPAPNGEELGLLLLNWISREDTGKFDDRRMANILEACCDVLRERGQVEQLSRMLSALVALTPEAEDLEEDSRLIDRAINRSYGVAAESAMALACNLLEQDLELPLGLTNLLHYCAEHFSPVIRSMVIYRNLSFIEYKAKGLGWALFEKAFAKPQKELWKYAEKFLYHQYYRSYDRVRPYLDRMRDEAPEKAGKGWGRLMTLCCLSDHFSLEELWRALEAGPSQAWKGAVHVFGSNLDMLVARDGMIRFLESDCVNGDLMSMIERDLADVKNQVHVTDELSMTFLQAVSRTSEARAELYSFVDWVEWRTMRDPVSAIEILEAIAIVAENREGLSYPIFIKTDPLVRALNTVLSEADERDDPDLIRRAVALQDRFLMFDITGMEKLFELAGRA